MSECKDSQCIEIKKSVEQLSIELDRLNKEIEKLYAARKEFSRNDWRTFGALALENEQLKSKLAKAKETINQIRNHNEACRVAVDMYWDKASEIGEG